MRWLRLPRLRWWGWLSVAAGLLIIYVVALSVVRAITRDHEPEANIERAREAVTAENWTLVIPADRTELSRAIDQAWRAMRGYRQVYRAGTAAELAADTPGVLADSVFNLTKSGRVAAQRDMNVTLASAPGSGGRDSRNELYRVLSDRPFTNSKGIKVGDSEFIYSRIGGVWSCVRDIADKRPIPLPGLQLEGAGDAGFAEIDGHQVRGFILSVGAFGLRWPSTVWVDTESLLVRRQEIESAVPGQREVWTYSGFDQISEIIPPSGITCADV
jgi:hypothetical protein